MRDAIIFGERLSEIADEMLGFDVTKRPGGGVSLDGRFAQDGPLLRAIFRAEAELLLADASAMAAGAWAWRDPDQRCAAAFMLVVDRINEAVHAPEPASAPRKKRPATAVPSTARGSSRKKRRRSG
jgi:hypothetical protein